jgi:hypothetical protein
VHRGDAGGAAGIARDALQHDGAIFRMSLSDSIIELFAAVVNRSAQFRSWID